MKEMLREIINNDHKNKTELGKNYCFIVTVAVAAVCILLYAFGGSDWPHSFFDFSPKADAVLDYRRLLFTYLQGFAHANWQHVILNMVCFFVCGLYLERKTGSARFIMLILAMTFFAQTAMSANYGGGVGVGFSGVNYALYAYIIIDYIFSLQKAGRTRFNIIFGAAVLALMYWAMCFDGGTSSFSFRWYPYDLLTHKGHNSGFLSGLVFGLMIQTVNMGIIKKDKKEERGR